GREAKDLGNGRRARADDVVMADDIDGGGRVAQPFAGLRDRNHFDLREFLDREIAQLLERLSPGGRYWLNRDGRHNGGDGKMLDRTQPQPPPPRRLGAPRSSCSE